MELIYFMVVWIATTAGALTGMGGGVIIKPVLDVIGEYDAATIGVLCSCTVFTMSIVSIHKQVRQKAKIDLSIALPLSAGSILGGWSGERLLRYIVAGQDNAVDLRARRDVDERLVEGAPVLRGDGVGVQERRRYLHMGEPALLVVLFRHFDHLSFPWGGRRSIAARVVSIVWFSRSVRHPGWTAGT